MIAIIVALPYEAAPVIELMEASDEYTRFEKKFYVGKLFGKQACLCICNVGKVNAASAAQYLIDNYSPSCIVNLGTAGGLNGSLNIADVLQVTRAVQYDYDLAELNSTEIGVLNEYTDKYLRFGTGIDFNLPAATLATGDRFNDSKADFNLITSVMGADLRDMEGAAIAQVAIKADVDFYCFKTVSDVVGKNTVVQYYENSVRAVNALAQKLDSIFARL